MRDIFMTVLGSRIFRVRATMFIVKTTKLFSVHAQARGIVAAWSLSPFSSPDGMFDDILRRCVEARAASL